jgi:hypothetical protein
MFFCTSLRSVGPARYEVGSWAQRLNDSTNKVNCGFKAGAPTGPAQRSRPTRSLSAHLWKLPRLKWRFHTRLYALGAKTVV